MGDGFITNSPLLILANSDLLGIGPLNGMSEYHAKADAAADAGKLSQVTTFSGSCEFNDVII